MESLDQGYSDDRFATAVDEDLHCPICLNVLKDPLQCQMNEHYFCTPCITRHLRNFQTCPSCMEELSVKTLRKPARYLTKHLSKLDIRCEKENRGCPEFVKLEDLNNHLTNCGFAPVTCSNNGCSQVINKQDRIGHETEVCQLRKVKCSDCAEVRMEIGQLKMSFKELKDEVSKMISEMREGVASPSPSIRVPSNADTKQDIIVVGGCDGVNRHVSAEMYFWSKNEWAPLDDAKEPHSASSSTLYKTQLLVIGGRTGDVSLTDSIEALHTDKQPARWLQYPVKLPYPCFTHSCVIYQDCLIVIGGVNNITEGKVSNSICEVSLTPPYTSKFLSHMSQPRHGHGTALLGDEIIIIGGYAAFNCNHMKSVLSFDIRTKMCKTITPLPYAVGSMATVTWGDCIILLGGKNSDGEELDTVMMYNIETGDTHMLPPMKYKRSHCTAIVTTNIIVVMGGYNRELGCLKVVEYFSFASFSWTELPPMIEKRSSATSVVKPVNFM